MKKPFKIIIIDSFKNDCWYKDMLGEVIEVRESWFNVDFYILVNDDSKLIHKKHTRRV
jgi:hypothetical protein